MKQNIPKFLEGFPIHSRHPIRKAPMNSWMNLHAYLKSNRGKLKLGDYARLLILELEREVPRIQILLRLKSEFDRERRRAENLELMNRC